MDVIERVRTYMSTELRIAGADTLATDYALVARGAVDSIELMQIVLFLEQSFSIKVDDKDVVPENLGTLAAIERLVHRKVDARSGLPGSSGPLASPAGT